MVGMGNLYLHGASGRLMAEIGKPLAHNRDAIVRSFTFHSSMNYRSVVLEAIQMVKKDSCIGGCI